MTCQLQYMQGDIESVAAMGAKELTNLFEQISGSDGFRAEYEDLEKQKVAADERLTFNFAKKRTAAQDRKAKKEQKDEAERHIKLQEELVGFTSCLLHSSEVGPVLASQGQFNRPLSSARFSDLLQGQRIGLFGVCCCCQADIKTCTPPSMTRSRAWQGQV